MITTAEEYLASLWRIQEDNRPSIALLLPSDENIYEVDLEKRIIEAPSFLSVEKDHRSEVIYFKAPRYFDNMDLTNAVCIIQYINAKGEGRVYTVPFYDTTTLSTFDTDGTYVETPMILFPWMIDQEVTKKAGDISFAIRFYIVDSSGTKIVYDLNTQPATSKVLHGITKPQQSYFDQEEDYFTSYLEQIQEYARRASENDLYWIDA